MNLKEALLSARQGGTPAAICKNEDGSYSVEPVEDMAFIYVGGDQMPVPLNDAARNELTKMVYDLAYDRTSKVGGAKIRRR